MRALWDRDDLNRTRHLHLVTSGTAAGTTGAGSAVVPGATVVDGSLPRRGAQLTAADLTDLEQLAILAARMDDATRKLRRAVKRRDTQGAATAARAVLHIGLRAGDLSRAMEKRR